MPCSHQLWSFRHSAFVVVPAADPAAVAFPSGAAGAAAAALVVGFKVNARPCVPALLLRALVAFTLFRAERSGELPREKKCDKTPWRSSFIVHGRCFRQSMFLLNRGARDHEEEN